MGKMMFMLPRRLLINCITPSSMCFISTSSILSHVPTLKKKGSKLTANALKLQKQRENKALKLKSKEVEPPPDPASVPDPSWLSADRRRPKVILREEVIDGRALLEKEWSRLQMKKHVNDLTILRDKMKSRRTALSELQKESVFLYDEAMKVDKTMFPLTLVGPTETPPLEDYIPPDFVDK